MKRGDLVKPHTDLRSGLWLDEELDGPNSLIAKGDHAFHIKEGTCCILLGVLADYRGMVCRILTPGGKVGYVGISYLESVG